MTNRNQVQKRTKRVKNKCSEVLFGGKLSVRMVKSGRNRLNVDDCIRSKVSGSYCTFAEDDLSQLLSIVVAVDEVRVSTRASLHSTQSR